MNISTLCRSAGFKHTVPHSPCDEKSPDTRCSPCTKLVDLDNKIEEACQDLMDLSAVSQRLLLGINQGHDLLTSRLPLELSSKIFELCNADGDSEVHFPKPMRLTQVCRSWRTISHSTPGLWTSLPIRICYPKEKRWIYWKSAAADWLHRCGDHYPLSISVSIDCETDTQRNYCATVYEIIKTYSHRLEHLEVDATAEFIQTLCSHYQGRITLSSLRIRRDGGNLEYNFRAPRKFIVKNLCLNRITLRGAGIVARSLSHVEVSNITVSGCVEIFKLAGQMVSCTLSDILWQFERKYPRAFVHQALKELDIKDDWSDGELTVFILGMVDLPSLERLSVDICDSDQDEVLLALTDHLRRSDSHLEVLTISGLWELQSPHFNDLMRIVGRSLQHLSFVADADFKWRDGTMIAAMVDTSLNDLAALKSVTMNSSIGFWPHTLKEIVSLGSAVVSRRPQKFLVILWSDYHHPPLDPQTGDLVLNSDHHLGNAAHSITNAEIDAIISAMQDPLLEIRIKVTEQRGDGCIDITGDIVNALGHYIEKSKKEGLLHVNIV